MDSRLRGNDDLGYGGLQFVPYIPPMTLTYDRRILAISGADAQKFLQGLITQDVGLLRADSLHFTAMLSAQGKLLYDGFLRLEGDAILWDVAADQAEALLAALKRYKLRAAVTLELREAGLRIGETGFVDPRHPDLPRREYGIAVEDGTAQAAHYHRTRLHAGVPEAAYDSQGTDVAMDLGYDTLGAISFTKGCYVGQEVTARMHYKQIARKAVMRVVADAPIDAIADGKLMAGDLAVGEVRSYMERNALALVKLESWEKALLENLPIRLGERPVELMVPEWEKPRIEQFRQGKLAANA